MNASVSDRPVILEAAINGMTSKEKNPNSPRSHDEIERDALRCFEMGATIVHAHNSDIALDGREAADDYLVPWRRILEARPDALWYPTLTASATMAERLEHIELIAQEIPLRMCAFDPGSTNIGQPGPDGLPVGGVYPVSYDDCRTAFAFCERLKMGPALGIYEPNSLRTTLAYHKAGKLPAGAMVKFYFGGDYGLMATEPGVSFGGDLMETPIARLALELGGHLHIGVEEFYSPDRSPSNEDLMAEAVELCAKVGRPVATLGQAAEMLALS